MGTGDQCTTKTMVRCAGRHEEDMREVPPCGRSHPLRVRRQRDAPILPSVRFERSSGPDGPTEGRGKVRKPMASVAPKTRWGVDVRRTRRTAEGSARFTRPRLMRRWASCNRSSESASIEQFHRPSQPSPDPGNIPSCFRPFRLPSRRRRHVRTALSPHRQTQSLVRYLHKLPHPIPTTPTTGCSRASA